MGGIKIGRCSMSLSSLHKNIIKNAMKGLKETLDALEDTPADYRALDILEIAISLLEQQLEQGTEFYISNDVTEASTEVPHPGEAQFKYLSEDDDNIPSPGELEDWFEIGS